MDRGYTATGNGGGGGGRDDRKRKQEETAAAASQGSESEVLKRKKELYMALMTEQPTVEEPAKKKKKKVVRARIPQRVMDMIMAQPHRINELPADRVVDLPAEIRAAYDKWIVVGEKMVAYEKALVDQYLTRGYAENESEVDDDDDDDIRWTKKN